MRKLDEHESLRGSGDRNIISYIHGRELYCCVCVALFKAELNFFPPVIHPAFYSTKLGSYTMT
jgi:hypothetical protein